MSDDGFVKVYRRVLDNPEFRDQSEAMAFVWLVMRASWKPCVVRYKGCQIGLERGQLAISVRDLADAFGRSKDWANRFLARLAKRDMIATASATGVNVITLCKYDEYQGSQVNVATPPARQPRQHRDSTATQNKEGKEGKEGLETNVSCPTSPCEAGQVVELFQVEDAPRQELTPEHVRDAWNDLAEKIGKPRIRGLTPERRQRVKARIAGYSLDDWLTAIEAVERSAFLRGDTGWHGFTFDWMMKKANFQKILEGNYDDKPTSTAARH